MKRTTTIKSPESDKSYFRNRSFRLTDQINSAMLRITTLLLFLLLSMTTMNGQNLEEDNLVLYTKANILYESGRYDEAIRMYNRILKNDENHTPALFMRAKTKYELGAYKGTKLDVLQFIEKAGVHKGLIQLMTKTEMRLNNYTAAANYAATGLELDPFDDDLLYSSGEISLQSGMQSQACEQFQKAAQLGNARAQRVLKETCYAISNSGKVDSTEDELAQEEMEENEVVDGGSESGGGIVSLEDIVKEAEDGTPSTQPTLPHEDKSTENEVDIDENLSIIITGGIGHREVTSQPSIFLLSDQEGIVVFDLCVNAQGKVTEAIFNREESTIFRSSLTSLALRKAKSFEFSPSRAPEQCGLMIFDISR